jgi:hypothetical protein
MYEVKGKFHHRTGHEGQDGVDVWLYSFFNLGGVGGQRHAPTALPPGKDLVPTLQEAGWASEPVWSGAKNV